MKLLKKGIDRDAWRKQYLAATEDCWKCPCCGETNDDKKSMLYYNINIIDSRHIHDSDMWVDVFRCDKCKAEWESSPYYEREHFRTLPKLSERFTGMPPGHRRNEK